MGREGDQLPKGWEHPIPDAIWPEALVSAVRADVGALAALRAIETIRRWKEEARTGSEPRAQREAKKWLRALADALTSEEADPRVAEFDAEGFLAMAQDSNVQDAFTMDARRVPNPRSPGGSSGITPSPTPGPGTGKREREAPSSAELKDRPLLAVRPTSRMATNATPPGEMMVDDDAILNEEPASIVSRIDQISRELAEVEGKTVPPGEFGDEDEKPTTLRKTGGGFYRGARVDPFSPFAEEDEKPTASIAIPEEMQRRNEADTPPRIQLPADDTKEVGPKSKKRKAVHAADDEVHEESAEERTVASSDGPKVIQSGVPPPLPPATPATPQAALQKVPSAPQAPSPAGKSDEDWDRADKDRERAEEDNAGGRLAPKPGIVRRRAISRKRESQVRPRAAMQQVKALHTVVMPLCEELIPLSVERRSRRFWARWREVAGDRGVRRDFIEDLLQSANDVRTMVCELIAEVQTVDVKSVYTLVQKIEMGSTIGPSAGVRANAPGTPERQRGPMVGASVRVEGVTPKSEED